MTIYYKTQGFVFKKEDINESDRIFSVFTSDFGRLDIFAKAIRKSVSKLRSGIDTFLISDIEFVQGKNKKTLTDAAIVNKFCNLPLNPERFRIANAIGGTLNKLLRGQEKDQNIFNLLDEVFNKLNSQKLKIQGLELLYYYFLWNFLALLGYKPEIYRCNACHDKLNPYNIHFSCKSGGVLCKKCQINDFSSTKINSDIVKILRLILKKDWQTI